MWDFLDMVKTQINRLFWEMFLLLGKFFKPLIIALWVLLIAGIIYAVLFRPSGVH